MLTKSDLAHTPGLWGWVKGQILILCSNVFLLELSMLILKGALHL